MKIHSTMGLVTNSSTTVYTYTSESTVTQLKAFLNVVLKVIGNENTADDLFNFEVVHTHDDIENIADHFLDSLEESDNPKDIELFEKLAGLPYTEREAEAYRIAVELGFEVVDYYGGVWTPEMKLVMTTKTGEPVNVSALYSLFEIDAEYNG